MPSAPTLHIAGHQLHADHGAGLEVGGIAHGALRASSAADVTPCRGSSPSGAELRREGSRVARVNPPKETGVAISIMLASPVETAFGCGKSARQVV